MSKDDLIIVEDEINDQANDAEAIINEDDPVDETIANHPDKFKGRVTQDGENITVKLAHPKEYVLRKNGIEQKKTLSEITFRPMNGGDLQSIASFRDETERGIRMFIRISNISEALYQRVDTRDLSFCGDAIAHFLSNGP